MNSFILINEIYDKYFSIIIISKKYAVMSCMLSWLIDDLIAISSLAEWDGFVLSYSL